MIKYIIICCIAYGLGYLDCYKKYDKAVEEIRSRLRKEIKIWQARNGRKADGL